MNESKPTHVSSQKYHFADAANTSNYKLKPLTIAVDELQRTLTGDIASGIAQSGACKVEMSDSAIIDWVYTTKSIQNEDPESDFVSHAHIDQDLRPRWPLGQDLAWHNYAGIGVMLEVPVDLVGFAIVSTETLSAKSIQVHKFDLNGTLIQHLMGFVQKVKSFEATQ